MAKKKKRYFGMSGGNANLPQEAFRRPFASMPRWSGATMDDSMAQMDYQMMEDIRILKKGRQKRKY